MLKRLIPLVLVIGLCLSCRTIKIELPRWPEETKTFTVDFSEPELTIYDIAEKETGCPARILRGIHFAESSYGKNLKHPNVFDRGHFGLSEKYHTERAKKWGEYNPDCPLQSAIIAGHIFMENLAILGTEDLAICAYRQGVAGVQKNGAELWYYERVLHAPSI